MWEKEREILPLNSDLKSVEGLLQLCVHSMTSILILYQNFLVSLNFLVFRLDSLIVSHFLSFYREFPSLSHLKFIVTMTFSTIYIYILLTVNEITKTQTSKGKLNINFFQINRPQCLLLQMILILNSMTSSIPFTKSCILRRNSLPIQTQLNYSQDLLLHLAIAHIESIPSACKVNAPIKAAQHAGSGSSSTS